MAMPHVKEIRLPLLQHAAKGEYRDNIVEALAGYFSLMEEAKKRTRTQRS